MTNSISAVTSVTTSPQQPSSSNQLHSVITELRIAVDHQLDKLIRSQASAPEVVRGLAHLEGILDIFGDYAKDWRSSDVLDALHTDLVGFNKTQTANLSRPSLGAYLNKSKTEDPFSKQGIRLQPSAPELVRGLM